MKKPLNYVCKYIRDISAKCVVFVGLGGFFVDLVENISSIKTILFDFNYLLVYKWEADGFDKHSFHFLITYIKRVFEAIVIMGRNEILNPPI